MHSPTQSKSTTFSLEKSAASLARAAQTLAGGESSSFRIAAGQLPTVIDRGQGALMWDLDGNKYIDFLTAYGALIFGHRPSHVLDAVSHQLAEHGSIFGMPHELNHQVSEAMVRLVPGLQSVRFASSGTEAVEAVLRLARAYTGRDKVVRFEGHYHGWGESIFAMSWPPLTVAGREESPRTIPGTTGMPPGVLDHVLVQSWNRPEYLKKLLRRRAHEIAAIITEPVMANSGIIPPEPGYLQFLREITQEYEIVLIFDEIITGFRLSDGGAQKHFGVHADLTVFGKALSGGFPIAAFGGRNNIMALEARNEVFHGGTYSGNGVSLSAALASLSYIQRHAADMYPRMFRLAERMSEGLAALLRAKNFHCVMQRVGPMFQIFMVDEPVGKLVNYRDVVRYARPDRFRRWQHALQRNGVYVHPSQFDRFYITTAHTEDLIEQALLAAERATAELYDEETARSM